MKFFDYLEKKYPYTNWGFMIGLFIFALYLVNKTIKNSNLHQGYEAWVLPTLFVLIFFFLFIIGENKFKKHIAKKLRGKK